MTFQGCSAHHGVSVATTLVKFKRGREAGKGNSCYTCFIDVLQY